VKDGLRSAGCGDLRREQKRHDAGDGAVGGPGFCAIKICNKNNSPLLETVSCETKPGVNLRGAVVGQFRLLRHGSDPGMSVYVIFNVSASTETHKVTSCIGNDFVREVCSSTLGYVTGYP
jgi:hypothetical protein